MISLFIKHILVYYRLILTGGEDYLEGSDIVVLSQFSTSEEVLFEIMDDSEYEGPQDETFLITATLMAGQNTDRINMGNSDLVITIEDNEPRPSELPLLMIIKLSEICKTT